ncbi:helicase IV [Oceanobacillus oncorhynchi subsp. incaldanensis]|uniref:RNA polymerase recycling motor HelD n=1 Tax=Oceanobacillus oncorhynchi TaxID=545501 RepID=UPI001B21B7B6|nr:RNA polymerase recycling motor HelD [Oceanobacillus oncorhynchi]GIO21202.1 helicase IV [Oceanobacillus oncorhynchi subsp. incaldanensis]
MDKQRDSHEFEYQRLEKVLDIIDKKQHALKEQSSKVKEDVVELRKTFWDDITVNMDEMDDIIETQESIKQQSNILAQKERHYGKNYQRMNQLERLKNQPYFGRVDFQEEGSEEIEKIYIGTSSLMDEEEKDFLIYDWRAPISSIYYDYAPGPVEYRTEEETVNGDMSLKRQYMIRNGKMKGIFDTSVTIIDEMLQESLSGAADTQMKSIVSTIQQEQNAVIRHRGSKVLVVQGAAGSGKTSAALQRIAYLLYHHRTNLTADQVLLLSPNDLFSSYVANVLPELGEEPVNQQTFHQFVLKGTDKALHVDTPFEQIEKLMGLEEEKQKSLRDEIQYFSSTAFMDTINQHLEKLNQTNLVFRSIRFRNELLIDKTEIEDYFASLEKDMRLPNKMEQLRNWLLQRIRAFQKEEIEKDWVLDQIQLLTKDDYMKAYHEAENEHEESSIQDEEKVLREKIIRKTFAPLQNMIRQNRFINTFKMYMDFIAELNGTSALQQYKAEAIRQLRKKQLPWELATAYNYFKGEMIGHQVNRPVHLIVMDEAQDYTPFQFAYLRHLYPYASFTLLGDVNQAIYSYASEENPIQENISFKESTERIVLTKSYRSTKPIADFTSYFSPSSEPVEPFERSGSLPEVIHLTKSISEKDALLHKIEEKQQEGYETIAIIAKTAGACDKIYQQLHKEIDIKQINEHTKTYQKGVVVVPVYLAKGIEFDAVILADASSEVYSHPTDKYLLYTACTRAMHDLTLLYSDKISPFLSEVPKEKYRYATIVER